MQTTTRACCPHPAVGFATPILPFALLLGALLTAAPFTPAQQGRGKPLYATVTAAAANERVTCMAPYQNGVTPTRDGSLFVLVGRTTYDDASRKGSRRQQVELWRSRDGCEWRLAATPPTFENSSASMTPDGDLLAVAWSATDGDEWRDVLFQRFDPARDAWIGEPTALARGAHADDQYVPHSLVRTASGALVAAIASHRSPPQPVWNHAWSLGMRWLPPDDTTWRDLQQVNVKGYGQGGNALVRGDEVDFTYFSRPDRTVHSLRTFDVATGEFRQVADQSASAKPADGTIVSGVAICCSDETGGRTLIHVLGQTQGGSGRLSISYSRQDFAPTTITLVEDPPLLSGAVTPTNYTLVRGPGNQVFAYFSKADERHANLWQCVVEQGRPLFAPTCVIEGVDGQFERLNGMRTMQAMSGLHVVSSGPTAEQQHGAVCVYGPALSRTVWGEKDR